MYQAPTAPLSIGGVLDDGFRLLKASFTKLFGLALVSAFIGQSPNLFMQGGTADAEATIPPAAGIAMLVTMVVNMIFYGAILSRVNAVSRSEEMSVAGSMSIGMNRFLPLFGCAICYSLAIVGGALLLLVPGIILSLSLALGPYLVITERMGPIEALKTSHRLVWGHWWRTAAIFSVVLFITMTAYTMVAVAAGLGAAVGPQGAGMPLLQWILIPLLTAVLTPVMYAFGMSVLNDLKLRSEGDDLGERIEAIAEA